MLQGVAFMLLIDTALYFQLRKQLKNKTARFIYWGITLLFIIAILSVNFWAGHLGTNAAQTLIGKILTVILLLYLPKTLFVIVNGIGMLAGTAKVPAARTTAKLFRYCALVLSSAFFLLILYGITLGRYSYKIKNIDICIPKLPDNFEDFKIVQLTDLHLGSFGKNYKGIQVLIDKVNSLQPDLIVFTGDMVNNLATEMEPWIEYFKNMHASYGKFAVMGNHDYGDYIWRENSPERERNIEQFRLNMREMGFTLLDNVNIPIVHKRDTIYLCGVENWGEPPFSRYGDLKKALEGAGTPVILLSHNPTHWKAEVLDYDIPLTLSGHTHAMQMGIEIGEFRWSPARYVYPEDNGLYESNGKYLYVSRGNGYFGFHGRIGQRPEIPVFRLQPCK